MPLGPLTDPAGRLRRVVRSLRAMALIATGFSTLIGINLLQLSSLALRPFSRRSFRRFNRWCANAWWGGCVIAAERLNRTRIVVSGEGVPEGENALLVSNHQNMPDVTTIMAFARSKGRLGDLKFFVKEALKWVPGVGWGMQFLSCPFLARNWTADRARVERTFATLIAENIPTWLVSFVEGTRSTAAKIARDQLYARDHGLAVLDHLLNPRTKGFVASVQGLGSHIAAVYDLTIGYVDGVPTLWQYINGAVERVHLHVRRFPVDELPKIESELARWLHARFEEKDRLLEHFYRYGFFPADPVAAEAP